MLLLEFTLRYPTLHPGVRENGSVTLFAYWWKTPNSNIIYYPPNFLYPGQAVLDKFKRSVLDENGRVRRMTHDQAREVARVAADGILLQVSRRPVAFGDSSPTLSCAAAINHDYSASI